MYLSYVSYLLVYLFNFFIVFFNILCDYAFYTHAYAYSHSCEHAYAYMIYFPNSYSTYALSYCVDVFREHAF